MTSVCSFKLITFFKFMPSGLQAVRSCIYQTYPGTTIFSMQGDVLVGTSEFSFLISAFSRLLDLMRGKQIKQRKTCYSFWVKTKAGRRNPLPTVLFGFLCIRKENHSSYCLCVFSSLALYHLGRGLL